MKKSGEALTLELEKNPDILAELGQLEQRPLLSRVCRRNHRVADPCRGQTGCKNLDMIVANDVSQEGAGFNVATNIARLLYRDGRVESLELMTKTRLAELILDPGGTATAG